MRAGAFFVENGRDAALCGEFLCNTYGIGENDHE